MGLRAPHPEPCSPWAPCFRVMCLGAPKAPRLSGPGHVLLQASSEPSLPLGDQRSPTFVSSETLGASSRLSHFLLYKTKS